AGLDLPGIPAPRQADLCRGQAAQPRVGRQGRLATLHHRGGDGPDEDAEPEDPEPRRQRPACGRAGWRIRRTYAMIPEPNPYNPAGPPYQHAPDALPAFC